MSGDESRRARGLVKTVYISDNALAEAQRQAAVGRVSTVLAIAESVRITEECGWTAEAQLLAQRLREERWAKRFRTEPTVEPGNPAARSRKRFGITKRVWMTEETHARLKALAAKCRLTLDQMVYVALVAAREHEPFGAWRA